MNHHLLISKYKDFISSALMEEGNLVQLNLEPLHTEHILGNIYVGKVKNIVKNINAAFVEIGQGVQCYLPIHELNGEKVQNGKELIVQVCRENIKTKLPSVTVNINFTGKYFVLTRGKTSISLSTKIEDTEERKRLKSFADAYKNKEYGFIVRTNAIGIPTETLKKELDRLISMYQNLYEYGMHKTRFSLLYTAPKGYLCDIRDGYSSNMESIIVEDITLYEEIKTYLKDYQPEDLSKLTLYQDSSLSLNQLYSLNTRIEKALQQRVWLKSGGSLVIQPTEALTVIDVNTGKAIQGKRNTEETFYKINQEAATEISRQIRLRNLSGIIIIDFIDMTSDRKKNDLMKHFKEVLKNDPIKTVVVDMTPLGLVEVTRKKVRKPLHEQIADF